MLYEGRKDHVQEEIESEWMQANKVGSGMCLHPIVKHIKHQMANRQRALQWNLLDCSDSNAAYKTEILGSTMHL